MPSDKLERIAQRLEAMQAKNEELREQLVARDVKRAEMTALHAQAQQVLQDQLSSLVAHNSLQLATFDAETEAMRARRQELKADYGELQPIFDGLTQVVPTDE